MGAPRYFRLAMRTFAYQGVMAARLAAENSNGQAAPNAPVATDALPELGGGERTKVAPAQRSYLYERLSSA